jgi:hypothetical protein
VYPAVTASLDGDTLSGRYSMPIEFSCSACQTKVRTPDDSAGKMARCPKCSTVLQIPAASTVNPPPPAFAPPPPGFSPLGSPPPGGPPAGSKPPSPAPNPFSDQANPLGVNPYQSPANYAPGYPGAGYRPDVRSKLIGPGIGMIVGGTLALLYVAVAIIMLAVSPDAFMMGEAPKNEAERVGYWVGVLSVIVLGTIFYGLEVAGGIAMVMGKGRPLALAGAIAGCMPCNVCCVFGLPFSIWALVVLNQSDVRAGFQ